MEPFEEKMRRGGQAAVEEVARFFVRADPVHKTLRGIVGQLDARGIAYAVAGGMALVAHGLNRTTVDVDILVTPEGLAAAHRALQGPDYAPLYAGSVSLRDQKTGVRVKFLVSGQYPGEGKPKPVAFPNPADVAVVFDGIRYLSLPTLIELKLASGLSHPGRRRDLADVQDLIRVLILDASVAKALHPSVQRTYLQLLKELMGGGAGSQ